MKEQPVKSVEIAEGEKSRQLMPQPLTELDLPTELNEALQSLTQEQKQELQSFIASRTESYSGPLPHPDYLVKYEAAFPGAAERIFQITEKEQQHRIDYDNRRLDGALSQAKRGQWMGYSLCGLFGVIALGMAYLGYPVVAGILASTTIVSLAVIFVLNQLPKGHNDNAHHQE